MTTSRALRDNYDRHNRSTVGGFGTIIKKALHRRSVVRSVLPY